MKKIIFPLIISLSFLMCAFLNVSAQENTFNEEDLKALKNDASKKLEDKTYRLTTTTYNNEVNQKPVVTEKSIWETIPPNKTHYIYETTTPNGIKQVESIQIGARSFTRENNGEWKEEGIGGIGTGNGFGNYSGDVKIEETIERKLTTKVQVNNQTTDLYETLTHYKFIYPTFTYASVRRESVWFNASGMLIRSESEFQDGLTKTISRTIKEYEYNPKNLKIEAPVIKKETR